MNLFNLTQRLFRRKATLFIVDPGYGAPVFDATGDFYRGFPWGDGVYMGTGWGTRTQRHEILVSFTQYIKNRWVYCISNDIQIIYQNSHIYGHRLIVNLEPVGGVLRSSFRYSSPANGIDVTGLSPKEILNTVMIHDVHVA
jgi:hypothetical protein